MDERPETIGIMFACNDYRNGGFAGRFDCVHFCGNKWEMDLECFGNPPRIDQSLAGTNGLLKVGRRAFKILRWNHWVGNWCWNMATVTPAIASQIANHLKAMGKFACSGGSFAGPSSQWDNVAAYTAADFRSETMAEPVEQPSVTEPKDALELLGFQPK